MVLSDGSVYECVEHGVTGFKAKTPEEFTRYMRLLVDKTELRRRMGEAARQAVLARHTVNQWREHWRRVWKMRYSKLFDGWAGRAAAVGFEGIRPSSE